MRVKTTCVEDANDHPALILNTSGARGNVGDSRTRGGAHVGYQHWQLLRMDIFPEDKNTSVAWSRCHGDVWSRSVIQGGSSTPHSFGACSSLTGKVYVLFSRP